MAKKEKVLPLRADRQVFLGLKPLEVSIIVFPFLCARGILVFKSGQSVICPVFRSFESLLPILKSHHLLRVRFNNGLTLATLMHLTNIANSGVFAIEPSFCQLSLVRQRTKV